MTVTRLKHPGCQCQGERCVCWPEGSYERYLTEWSGAHWTVHATDDLRTFWDASRAELKRQLLEEVLPDLRGYYDGRDVLEALRKRVEAL